MEIRRKYRYTSKHTYIYQYHLLLLVPVPALDPVRRYVLSVRVLERRRDGQVRHIVAVQLQVLQRRKQAL